MSVLVDSKSEIRSEDIFERFYRAIESEKQYPSWPGNQIESLNRLKILLLTTENCLRDFSDNIGQGEQYIPILTVFDLTNTLMEKWYKFFTKGSITYWSTLDIADTIAYNLIPIIAVLDNFESTGIKRLNEKFLKRLNNFSIGNLASYAKDDQFKIPFWRDYLILKDVYAIRKNISEEDFVPKLKKVFTFDDSKKYVVWTVIVKITPVERESKESEEPEEFEEFEKEIETKYDAADIGFLMFSLAKAFESIDDIEVTLADWGQGSRWFKFKVNINSLTSKKDLILLLTKARQAIEAALYKKPFDEITKLEAEKDKILAEKKKVEIETSIIDPEIEKLKQIVSLHKELIELQKSEIEIEERKVNVRLKNLEYIEKLSDVIKNGVQQNDSNIQIIVNEVLYLEIDRLKNSIKADPIEFIDVREEIKSKE
jgi:hypothetical protein